MAFLNLELLGTSIFKTSIISQEPHKEIEL